MKTIVVTEINFNSILKKLQKICNKYKMLKFYRVLSEDGTVQKEYSNNPIGFTSNYKTFVDKYGNGTYKKKRKFYMTNSYIKVTKHPFREAFENYDFDKSEAIDKYNVEIYNERKPLIHLDLSASQALVVHEGDKIKFLPFGGFIIYTDNKFTNFYDESLSIYKETFIPDFIKGKIKDLEYENNKRDKEWEEEELLMMECYYDPYDD